MNQCDPGGLREHRPGVGCKKRVNALFPAWHSLVPPMWYSDHHSLYPPLRHRHTRPLFTGRYVYIGAEAPGGVTRAPKPISSMTLLSNEECWTVYWAGKKKQKTTKNFVTKQTRLHLNLGSTSCLHQLVLVCKMEMIRPVAEDGYGDKFSQTV